MIVKDEFLNQLRQFFNLNLYEVKIWTALLSRGKSTAGELSEIGDVPRSRAYDVLESLEKKGFIVLKLGKPIKYIAVEPEEVVERAKKLVHTEAKVAAKKLESLKGGDLLNELTTLFSKGVEFVEPADLSGSLQGRKNIYTHMETLLKKAKKSVSLITSSEGLVRKAETLTPVLQALSKKGVKIKIAANLNEETKKVAKELSKFAEIKNAKGTDARFCVIDNKDVVFMLMDDKEIHPSYDVGVWVNTPFFAATLDNMFNLAWKNMEKA